MSQFDNVSVVREANIYFDGNVTSRSVVFADGTRKTLVITSYSIHYTKLYERIFILTVM